MAKKPVIELWSCGVRPIGEDIKQGFLPDELNDPPQWEMSWKVMHLRGVKSLPAEKQGLVEVDGTFPALREFLLRDPRAQHVVASITKSITEDLLIKAESGFEAALSRYLVMGLRGLHRPVAIAEAVAEHLSQMLSHSYEIQVIHYELLECDGSDEPEHSDHSETSLNSAFEVVSSSTRSTSSAGDGQPGRAKVIGQMHAPGKVVRFQSK